MLIAALTATGASTGRAEERSQVGCAGAQHDHRRSGTASGQSTARQFNAAALHPLLSPASAVCRFVPAIATSVSELFF